MQEKVKSMSLAYELTNGFDMKSKLSIIGSTEDVTECGCCGKTGLKRTAVIQDEWGQINWFGSSCAYNAVYIWNKSTFEQRILKQQAKSKASAELSIDDYKYIFIIDLKDEINIYCKHERDLEDKWRNISHQADHFMPSYGESIWRAAESRTLASIPNINQVIEWLETYTKFRLPF